MFSCVMRWNGFVDGSAAGAGGRVTGAASVETAGDDASDACDIILKYGFLLSVSAGGEVTTAGGGGDVAGIAGGGLGFRSCSWWLIWLPPSVGVDSCGVICSGPSSSEEESSSFMASSWR